MTSVAVLGMGCKAPAADGPGPSTPEDLVAALSDLGI
jgi:hypothetical protein